MLYALLVSSSAIAADADVISYNAESQLNIPANYREWVFLTASMDLNYDAPVPGAPANATHSMLDNIFVNPAAYKAFMATDMWPDKTVMNKENRRAVEAGSISTRGEFQTDMVSMEFHVKDKGSWAFFASNGRNPGRPMPVDADCYSCHSIHGAVDTTFVQFYPTLLDVAKAKGTLSADYVKTEATTAKGK